MLPDGIGLELDPEAAAKRGAEAGKQLKDFLPNPPGQGGTISARLNPLEDLEVKPKAKKPRHEIIGEFNALAAGTEPLGRNDGKWVIGTSDNDLWFPYSTGAVVAVRSYPLICTRCNPVHKPGSWLQEDINQPAQWQDIF